MQKNNKKHLKRVKEKFQLEREAGLQNKENISPEHISKRSSDLERPGKKRTVIYLKSS